MGTFKKVGLIFAIVMLGGCTAATSRDGSSAEPVAEQGDHYEWENTCSIVESAFVECRIWTPDSDLCVEREDRVRCCEGDLADTYFDLCSGFDPNAAVDPGSADPAGTVTPAPESDESSPQVEPSEPAAEPTWDWTFEDQCRSLDSQAMDAYHTNGYTGADPNEIEECCEAMGEELENLCD